MTLKLSSLEDELPKPLFQLWNSNNYPMFYVKTGIAFNCVGTILWL